MKMRKVPIGNVFRLGESLILKTHNDGGINCHTQNWQRVAESAIVDDIGPATEYGKHKGRIGAHTIKLTNIQAIWHNPNAID